MLYQKQSLSHFVTAPFTQGSLIVVYFYVRQWVERHAPLHTHFAKARGSATCGKSLQQMNNGFGWSVTLLCALVS